MSRSPHRSAVWLRAALAALTLVAAAPRPADAQFDRGTISGTITDQQGGVVPGVTVTVKNQATQQTRTAVTDSSGFYTLPLLEPSRYEISAELDGFKRVTRQNVQLDAGGSVTVPFTLEAGAMTEVVTVTAEAPPLQTDVTIRKTVEAKDIEQLSFSGRNPIGVAGLKAGVSGGNFNSRGFNDLGNGGYNINGSRADENNITIDGATAIRTRSSGAIIGIQNVDAIQEVQVLTANYMPEYGRSSGGQIRFVTKSGSNRYTGSASIFFRDESLQANSWSRNRSTNPAENSGPAPFDYKQYGYAFGGPIPGEMFRNKLFFFGAQEWVNFFQVSTNTATVPTMLMRQGNFSELLDPNNGFYSGARTVRDPLTGQPFPGNIIPADRLSPNGLAMLNRYPEPTAGFRQGSANLIQTSPNPQDQRKDNIRFDYRLDDRNQVSYRFSRYNWVAVDAFRGSFPFARTDWERPNFTSTASWTSTISNNLINELTYTFSRDDVFIDVFEGGNFQRGGINYPYVFRRRRSSTRSRRFRSAGSAPSTAGPTRRSPRGRSTRSRTSRRWCAGATRSRPGSSSSTPVRTTSTRSTSTRRPAAPTTRTAASPSTTSSRGRASATWRSACSPTTPNWASATSPSGAPRPSTPSSRIPGSRPAS
jgi:hypothetical protein